MPSSMQEFMDILGLHFPEGTVDVDNDGQLIIYTNLELITDHDNPSIPAGEHIVQSMGAY